MRAGELDRTAIVSGILFIVLGAMFFLEQAGVLEVRGAYILPLVLICLGVAILLGGSPSRRGRYREDVDVAVKARRDRFWDESEASGHSQSSDEGGGMPTASGDDR